MKKKHKARRSGRGVLSLVMALLVGSAVVRLATGTGDAIARELQPDPVPSVTEAANVPAMDRDGLQSMLEDFQKREAELKQREQLMEERALELAQAEALIEEKLLALVDAEDQLRATLALAAGASETDLTQLTSVYESMKPKEAAALFEEMAPEFAAGFIGRMRADAAAGIMAGLSPQTAYSISVVMAGRHSAVPTQ